jgi:hypothetical protein
MNRHVADIFASGFRLIPAPEHDPPARVDVVIGVEAKLPTPGIAKPSPTGQAVEPDPAWMARLVASL